MLKGYMDESGIANEPVCVVGGFVGDEATCDDAADKWQQVLDDFLVPEFHSFEFWKREKGAMTGKYRHLHICEARDFLLRLMHSIELLTPVGMAIDVPVFKSLSQDERIYLTTNALCRTDWPSKGTPNDAYFLPFQYCVISPLRLVPAGEKIYFTFDRQDNYKSRAIDLYNQILSLKLEYIARLGETIAFSGKREAVLLQAADLVAFLTRWFAEKSLENIRDKGARRGVLRFVVEQDYVLGMGSKGLDALLRKCPFRSSFWKDMTEPDLIEDLRSQGVNVLPYKGDDGTYYSHHIIKERVVNRRAVTFEQTNKN